MNLVVLLALAGGTCARIPALCIQANRIDFRIWKTIPLTILLTVVEFTGTLILFYIENGYFSGMSYYGGILLMPIFCIVLAKLFNIRYLDLMDMCGAAAGGMLAVMRLQCVYFGCCNGITIHLPHEISFVFPSPIVELVTVLILMCIVLWLGRKDENKGKLYPYYLILYGVTRFVLNWFRSGNKPFVWILPPGNFWSIIAIAIGVVWLLYFKVSRRK